MAEKVKPIDFYSDDKALAKAMASAVRKALRSHKLLSDPIVIWQEGKIVWVPPEEIVVPAEQNGDDQEH
jgi:hypothetical protein